MDTFTKDKRSKIMSRIKSYDTKPEVLLKKYLANRIQNIESNVSYLLGKPDIVIKSKKTIIFLNGCFWHHHHNCSRANLPKSNKTYWVPKIKNNVKRDIRVRRTLRRMGWSVITVWECQVRRLDKFSKLTKLF